MPVSCCLAHQGFNPALGGGCVVIVVLMVVGGKGEFTLVLKRPDTSHSTTPACRHLSESHWCCCCTILLVLLLSHIKMLAGIMFITYGDLGYCIMTDKNHFSTGKADQANK